MLCGWKKGQRGDELTNEVILPETDAMCFVKLDKAYLGVEAMRASAEANSLPWICAYLEIEPDGEVDGHGGEAVPMEGAVVGSTASVAYGHSVGKVLTFAYIKPEAATPGTDLKVMIHGTMRTARVLDMPVYDPESLRPRADLHQEDAE